MSAQRSAVPDRRLTIRHRAWRRGTGVAARSKRLRVEALRVHFAGVKALDGVDLIFERPEILGLIGPNGAGKTTLVNAISGFQTLTEGCVLLDDRDVSTLAAHRLSRLGVVRTFQSVRPFAGLTLRENIEAAGLGGGLDRRAAGALADELIDRFGLRDAADSPSRGLPHGAERALGIARALAGRPDFLLLDEPAAGLNEREGDALVAVLATVRDEFACGIMVIEHDMRVIMALCDRIHVLDQGRTIAVGTPAEIRRDQAVLAAYLGTEEGVDASG